MDVRRPVNRMTCISVHLALYFQSKKGEVFHLSLKLTLDSVRFAKQRRAVASYHLISLDLIKQQAISIPYCLGLFLVNGTLVRQFLDRPSHV